VAPSGFERLAPRLEAILGPGPAARVAAAPGRVNLIGEHTDYNDGFVLPMAIDRVVAAAFRPRSDRRLRAHAVAFQETREADLDALQPDGHGGWMAYIAGVAWAFQSVGHRLPGLDLVIDGDVPLGAGLSSSAALEVAVALAMATVAGLPWEPAAMAALARRAETDFVGVACGVMDQMAATACRQGHALLLDCRSLTGVPIPLPRGVAVIVMDTGVRRQLSASAYNDRRHSCQTAVLALQRLDPEVRALRDVSADLLERGRDLLDAATWRRAGHVVAEMARPQAFAAALDAGDLQRAGRLLDESHASLRDLYQVSCPELDLVTDLAHSQPGCLGARMTGAGFGGCALALVQAGHTGAFLDSMARTYHAKSGREGAFFACRPAAGARLLV
jgi:galactokinase